MKCAQLLEELRQNMLVLDSYLDKKCDSEYSFDLKLIKKGTCFILLKQRLGIGFIQAHL